MNQQHLVLAMVVPAFVLSWVVPIAIQALTPIATQMVKDLARWLHGKLPDSVIVLVAGVMGESLNMLQGYLTGMNLPPGASTALGILFNEFLTDISGKEAPPSPLASLPSAAPVIGSKV